MSEKITLGYWNIRGLQAPIVMALHYTNTPFDHVLYNSVNGDRSEWDNVKASIPTPFPNLPYFTLPDGNCITQSGAILRYLARSSTLYGEPTQATLVDMLSGCVGDLKKSTSWFVYHAPKDNFESTRQGFIANTAAPKFKLWEKYLSHEHRFLVGDKPTFADFELYELTTQLFALLPEVKKDCPNLTTLLANIEALPELASYFQSALYKDYQHRFNNSAATWVGPSQ